MKSTNAELPLYSTQPAQASQDDVESLKIQRQSLKEKNSELTRTVDGLKLDVEELKLNAENDKRKLELLKNECDEWRRKYKEEVKVTRRVDVRRRRSRSA